MSISVNGAVKQRKGMLLLDDISLEVEAGRIVGISGPNGSGKTLVMRAIAGLLSLDEGDVIVDGKHIIPGYSYPESMGLLIENPAFLSLYSGFSNLEILASIKGMISKEDIIGTLHEVGLGGCEYIQYRRYSLGMKQRLGIASAVMESPSNILLDEPTNALDSNGIKMLKNLMLRKKSEGVAILWSCHDRDLLEELSDEIYCIEEGRLHARNA